MIVEYEVEASVARQRRTTTLESDALKPGMLNDHLPPDGTTKLSPLHVTSLLPRIVVNVDDASPQPKTLVYPVVGPVGGQF